MKLRPLENKKIIVTGASSGIGERIVWHIAASGGIPLLVARSTDKMKKQCETIMQTFNTDCCYYTSDLSNTSEMERTIELIFQDHAKIDGLINNAGFGKFQLVEDMSMQDVENMFQVNVLSLIHFTKMLLPHFQQNQHGHIVNLASQAGKISTPKSAVYAATKHAVIGFTNSLRMEIEKDNIFVTTVNLGPVDTNFFTQADPDGYYKKSVSRYMLNPDRVASKVSRHLFKQKREINMPGWMEIGSRLYHLFPSVMENLLKSQFNKK
ncbi:SDR family NAD(P)-dependent oxidoreductase [Oceanobacillus manasiensis]|uniref:SDR family NAD(P)-dependent oxidoreductase n=1 Tax=Oceanobacillus manasiensis TaxID=586413 RepID=UPI0005AACC44|nr:SDR family oxidoreductase [Oceanobacillus manasiensis]